MRCLALVLMFPVLLSATCHKTTRSVKAATTNCFKGRLAIKGICMNYVIQVLEGDTAALQLEKSWTDETDGTVHENVFALGSRCDFPDLEEGEVFHFTVVEKTDLSCNLCMAYRPVPAAKNNIVVSKTPCP